jgi:PPK2 family polyphosphate:nucleotide phosphotransferase
MQYPDWLRVDPEHFRLDEIKTRTKAGPGGIKLVREAAERAHADNIDALKALQYKMWAQGVHKLLVVLQALDTGGKDGAIRKTFGPLNPQGVKTVAFKRPTDEELAHDYLWRVHEHTPAAGKIQIFNRSHYEDVLVVRVHNYVPESRWRKRYKHIRDFEEMLADEGTMILKFMLHISKEEQRERLQQRLDDPERHWKFDKGDLKERALWDDYQAAFQELLTQTSRPHAPWYVIPADRKWYRNLCISTIVRQTLESAELEWPEPQEGLDQVVIT